MPDTEIPQIPAEDTSDITPDLTESKDTVEISSYEEEESGKDFEKDEETSETDITKEELNKITGEREEDVFRVTEETLARSEYEGDVSNEAKKLGIPMDEDKRIQGIIVTEAERCLRDMEKIVNGAAETTEATKDPVIEIADTEKKLGNGEVNEKQVEKSEEILQEAGEEVEKREEKQEVLEEIKETEETPEQQEERIKNEIMGEIQKLLDEELNQKTNGILEQMNMTEMTKGITSEELDEFMKGLNQRLDKLSPIDKSLIRGNLSALEMLQGEEKDKFKEILKVLLKIAIKTGAKLISTVARNIAKSANKDDKGTQVFFNTIADLTDFGSETIAGKGSVHEDIKTLVNIMRA